MKSTYFRPIVICGILLLTAGCGKKEPDAITASQAPAGAMQATPAGSPGAQAQSTKPNFKPGPGSDL